MKMPARTDTDEQFKAKRGEIIAVGKRERNAVYRAAEKRSL
ncbi:hypothetical protein IMCC9480_2491 [Oxalobacteraceae bacterium IMCC9480]|nr:hypothetical protein IMCC9480_2491 [Oxalobacteraceae bacterium IMCC9480]